MTKPYYLSLDRSQCWMQGYLTSNRTKVKFVRCLEIRRPNMSTIKAILAHIIGGIGGHLNYMAKLWHYENSVVGGLEPDIRWEKRGDVFVPVDVMCGIEMPHLSMIEPPSSTVKP